jgi:hypothetical protein
MGLKNAVLVQSVTEKRETDDEQIYLGYRVHYFEYKTNFLPILQITNNRAQPRRTNRRCFTNYIIFLSYHRMTRLVTYLPTLILTRCYISPYMWPQIQYVSISTDTVCQYLYRYSMSVSLQIQYVSISTDTVCQYFCTYISQYNMYLPSVISVTGEELIK